MKYCFLMINNILQAGLLITSAIAIYLTQQGDQELAAYASIFGLVGQPFWFYTSYKAKQWGVFVLSFFYAYSWGLGFYNYWGGYFL